MSEPTEIEDKPGMVMTDLGAVQRFLVPIQLWGICTVALVFLLFRFRVHPWVSLAVGAVYLIWLIYWICSPSSLRNVR